MDGGVYKTSESIELYVLRRRQLQRQGTEAMGQDRAREQVFKKGLHKNKLHLSQKEKLQLVFNS